MENIQWKITTDQRIVIMHSTVRATPIIHFPLPTYLLYPKSAIIKV